MSRILRSGGRFRSALPSTVAVTAGSALALYYYQRSQNALAADADLKEVTTEAVSTLWSPPSRSEMIEALKKSKSMPRAKSDIASARYSAVADDTSNAQHGDSDEYDLLIIGGGATGAGVALDAASRGLKVAIVERNDWASGTSSKSTKLVHGGVRYLQKAIMELDYEQWKLVKEALHERKTFLHIAPHLSHHLPIMLPVYTWWKLPYYWVGTKMYDVLAGKENMESSYLMSKGKSLEQFPMLKSEGLVGSLVYYDGQHNDARMNISLVMTAVHHGAVAANYVEVTQINKSKNADGQERCSGAVLKDNSTGETFTVKAKGVINATGPFTDGVRKLDDPSTPEIVAPSSGVHITLPKYYSPGSMGLLDPATSDGRVIFFLPWQGNAIAGTTDAPSEVSQDPVPKEDEIQWILGEVRNYLSADIKVRRGDVLSAWSGIRPLVRNPKSKGTEGLVRNHIIDISPTGLLTIAGGKWTTYRAMAAETVDAAIKEYDLKPTGPCVTEKLRLLGSHGWHKNLFVSLIQQFGLDTDVAQHLSENYGSLAWAVCSMAEKTGLRFPVHGTRIDPQYSYIEAEVRWGCRREQAVTATDIIARRTRISFLNAQAALEALPRIIAIMTQEFGWTEAKQEQEFKDAQEHLKSMGLPDAQRSLTFAQVKAGEGRTTAQNNPYTSRTIFAPEELDTLQKTFASMDNDKDGKINEADLGAAMKKAGYTNIKKEQIQSIIRDIDSDKDGNIEMSEFLSAAAGLKELQIASAFTQVVTDVQTAELRGYGKSHDEQKIEGTQGRISVERSGGGT